ncbi:MAG TPA: ABC transporter ATP-binding protein [Candidatus Polarisedimenticolia bacterium]|nr:ABC transporter ATP-binding protein [Candidatus Polarisedimenticolia bacterium]
MTNARDAAPALQVSEVRYAYGKTKAVDGVSFDVRRGEIFGLLGPNGAGKTTTIALIGGLLSPASGSVLLFGRDVASGGSARARLGVVPQDVALYEELTGRENVRFFGRLYGLSGKPLDRATDEALGQVGLSDRARDRAGALSGGLKRRLNLAAALVHSPDLLLLDEPTVGIDPQARLRILDVVKAQASAGRAVLYTSHYLEEAEQICDRLAIVDHGRVLAVGTVAELRRLAGEGPVVQVRGEIEPPQAQELQQRVPGVHLLGSADGVHSFAAADAAACAALVRELFQGAARVEDLRVQEPTLQSLFLKLTGRELRD